MGRMLGSHDNPEEINRPDLNQCPDCLCYFHDDHCPLCGKLCPKEAILDNAGAQTHKIPKDQWEKPVIDVTRCVGCSLCVENCPQDCLEIQGPAFKGDINTVAAMTDSSKCISCKICMKACPIGAVSF